MDGPATQLESTYRFEERVRKEFLVLRNADHVIATSYEQIGQLRDDYEVPDDHVTMIPPGFDKRRFNPVPSAEVRRIRRRLHFHQHDVYAVGRAARNKGYDLLIRSLPVLRTLVPDARLQLAIGGDSARDRRKIKQLQDVAAGAGVEEHIGWHGYVEDDDMADYYRAGGLFALPSRYEPFGMTAVESMACGTPAVITIHGGLQELVDFGDNSLFADPRRPMEWAAMMAMPLRYPRLRERLATRGARFVRREFEWGGIARRTLDLHERFRREYAERHGDGPAGT
jgi:mannosylfructose-phosphate synthase